MSEETPGGSKGLLDSLKGPAASLIAIVHTRLELLSVDLEEERARLLSVLAMLLIALFCLGMGVLLLTILVAAAFWDSHRLLALGGLAGIFLAGGAAVLGVARHKMKTKPKVFAASLAELSKDRQQLSHPS